MVVADLAGICQRLACRLLHTSSLNGAARLINFDAYADVTSIGDDDDADVAATILDTQAL